MTVTNIEYTIFNKRFESFSFGETFMIIISVKCDEGWSFKGGSKATVNGSSGLRSTATLSDPATALTEKRYAFEATCMISPEQILNDDERVCQRQISRIHEKAGFRQRYQE